MFYVSSITTEINVWDTSERPTMITVTCNGIIEAAHIFSKMTGSTDFSDVHMSSKRRPCDSGKYRSDLMTAEEFILWTMK